MDANRPADSPPIPTPHLPAWLARAITRWHASSDTAPPCRVEPGTPADLAALASRHYRAGPPATCILILRALDPTTRELAGVLTISNPSLNNAARRIAWPDAFPPHIPPQSLIDRLNREVRTISRVIVDPRFRGLGIATALIRAYLRTPLTPRTEAIAAMGHVCPFFQAAGMRRITPPTTARERTFARTLQSLGVSPLQLVETRSARRHLRRASVRRALDTWHRSARLLIPADAPLDEVAARAAGRVLAPPLVFVSP